MPNIKSAKKRVKQNENKRIRNKALRTFIRHLRKNTQNTFVEKSVEKEEASAMLNNFKKKIDQAWSKGILPKNTSSRIKSSMEHLYNKVYSA